MNINKIKTDIYVEIVSLGVGKLTRSGVCGLLIYKEHKKVVGQYLGIGASKRDLQVNSLSLVLASLQRPASLRIHSATVKPQKDLDYLFEWKMLAEASNPFQRAVTWAAYEIALGGSVEDFILTYVLESCEKDKQEILIARAR